MMKNNPDTGAVAAVRDLKNDTIVNVAQLLQEQVGGFRRFRIELDWFALDTDLMARDISGDLHVLRISTGLMVTGTLRGVALLECVRCLEIYDQPFQAEVEQEFRPLLELHSAAADVEEGPKEEVEDLNEIDDLNQIDFAESIREAAILALPMQPICGENCPGPDVEIDEESIGDHRFAVLGELLDDQADAEE